MFEVALSVAGYSDTQIVRDVRFCLEQGKVLSLLGRNGVGKSTLIKALVGLLPVVRGSIKLYGNSIVGLPTYKIARLGLGYVPQGRCIFPKLTVLENLEVGTRAAGGSKDAIPDAVFSYFPILKKRLSQNGGTMSGGEQQMLAIARALCGHPKVLLMDEPTDGVQPSVVQMLAELIPAIAKEEGMSILLVEQNIDLALGVAGECLIMEKGVIVEEGTPESFRDSELLARYLAV